MKNFLNQNDYAFLKEIKNACEDIKNEFELMSDVSHPYYEFNLHNGKWEIIALRHQNKDIKTNISLFPKTTKIFKSLGDKIYTCAFSILQPGCEIIEHVNNDHGVLRCHLCLSTNQDCAIIVNGETKKWIPGDFLIFDDTNPHSAYNHGDTPRVVVLFDFYK